MPVFDQGYRPYEGKLKSRVFRWLPITRRCLGTTRKLPLIVALVIGAGPLAIKLLQAYTTGVMEGQFNMGNQWGFGDGLFFDLLSLEIFFTVLLLMVVGAGQIAEDIRTGALQIYFAKPITHADYVLGKLGTVVAAASLLTLAPGLVLLIASLAFAPDWSFITENPLLPLKIVGFALLISIVLGSLVLAISSLGRRGRMVGVTFAGGYFLTMVLGRAMPRIMRDARWEVVHIGNCLDAAGRTLFNAGPKPSAPPDLSWGILCGLFFLCVLILARRVKTVEVVQ
ncbi:MAG: ABC transporter permease [Planctomycetota bacterium]|jgi:hypothetical protein